MLSLIRISSPSISARGITGIEVARAVTSSGFVLGIAEEKTTTSASRTLSSAWPTAIRAPFLTKRRVVSDSRASDPETENP